MAADGEEPLTPEQRTEQSHSAEGVTPSEWVTDPQPALQVPPPDCSVWERCPAPGAWLRCQPVPTVAWGKGWETQGAPSVRAHPLSLTVTAA